MENVFGGMTLGVQEQRGLSGVSPLKDYSLFDNDSEDSDQDEFEPITLTRISIDDNTKPKAFCFLSGDELLCEVDGDAKVFCVRLCKTSEPEILITTIQDSRMKKVQVQENDLLVVVIGKTGEGNIAEFMKKKLLEESIKGNVQRKLSKEIGEYLETREKDVKATIIVAKISREI